MIFTNNKLELLGTISLLKDISFAIAIELEHIKEELKFTDELNIQNLVSLVDDMCVKVGNLEKKEIDLSMLDEEKI